MKTTFRVLCLYTSFVHVLRHRMKIVIASCTVFFLLGLPMCTTGGLHLFNIFDQRCTSSLLLLCLIEVCNINKLFPQSCVSPKRFILTKFIIFLTLGFHGSTLQRKYHLCIPFLVIARPQSQFPHLCDVSDLYISRICPHIWLQQNRPTDPGNI